MSRAPFWWLWTSLVVSIAACVLCGYAAWSTGDGSFVVATGVWGFGAGLDGARLLYRWSQSC